MGKLEKFGFNFANKKDEKKFKGMPEEERKKAEKIFIEESLEREKRSADRGSGFGIPKEEKVLSKEAAVTEILSGAGLSGGFGMPKQEKVLEEKKEGSSAGVTEKPAAETVKEKEVNSLREAFVRAQMGLEKAKKAGGYDLEDFKAKKVPLEKKLEDAKKSYFEFLNNNEGRTNEEKGKFVSEEFNKLQDIKINLRSEEEAKTSHFPFNAIKTVGNWYRKQSIKDKYIVAAGLIGGGIFAGVAGSAVLASAVGMTAVFSRILSGAGMAVALETAIAQGKGKKFGMHMGHKGLMEERTAEEIEKIKKGITVESAAGFFEKNEGELSAASEKLYKESKNLETQRQLISGAMGALIATGAFGDVMKKAIHGLGIDKAMSNIDKDMRNAFNWTKEHLGFGGHEKVAVLAGSVDAHELAPIESDNINKLAMIRKGEGITQTLERQLEHDPAKFGFSGHDINNAGEVHKWAQRHAYELAVKNGFVSEKGNEILAGTQHVLEKDPLHYGFKGDIKDINKVHEWALREAHDVAVKTGTDVPGVSETRVKWNYGQSADKQAAYVLGPDGKVTEVLSSAKNPHYLYDTSEVIKTQKGLDSVNEQIRVNEANIDKLEGEAAREARRRLATGTGSYHAEKELDKALSNVDALTAEKARLEYQFKFHSGENVSKHALEAGHHAGVSHTEIKGDKLAEKIAHIETQFDKDNAFLLNKIPSGLKESLMHSDKGIDLNRIEPEFNKLDFEHQNNIIKFIDSKVINAHVKAVGETAALSQKLSEHLSQNHSYLKNTAEFLKEKAGFKFDAGLLDKIKNMSIDDLHKSIKTMALTKSPHWGGGLTLSNRHLGAYEDLSEFIKEHSRANGNLKIYKVLEGVAANLRNK